MTDALERSRAGHFKQDGPGFAEYVAARNCLEAGQKLELDVWYKLEGIALLTHALPLALEARRARQKLDVPRQLRQLWAAFAEHPDEWKCSRPLTVEEREVIAGFLDDTDPLTTLRMSSEHRELLGRTLFNVISELLAGLERETQSEKQVKAIRLFRLVLLPLCSMLVLFGAYGWFTRPVNWALNMPVQLSSSYRPEIYPGPALVNGDTSSLAIHTMSEAQPWAQIDLGKERKIRRIEVFNRQDLRQNSTPLKIETSSDGKRFIEFSHIDTEFLHWTAKGKPVTARYVRLTVPRVSSLQLAEVEIY